MGGTAVRHRECVAMNGGRDERLRPAVAVVAVPLLVGRPIMLDLEHKQSVYSKKLCYSIWNLLNITFNNVRDARY